jgi:hypothetical protein
MDVFGKAFVPAYIHLYIRIIIEILLCLISNWAVLGGSAPVS